MQNAEEIKNRLPFIRMKIIDKNNTIQQLYCVRKKPVNKPKYKNQKYDQERFYLILDNTLMLVQYKQFEDFSTKERIKKEFFPWK